MVRWHSLFLFSKDALPSEAAANTLRSALHHAGYTLYDPFGIMAGKAYPDRVGCFVAPSLQEVPLRILIEAVEPDIIEALASALSTQRICCSVGLDGDTASLTIYRDGEIADEAVLAPFLRHPDQVSHHKAPQTLQRAGKVPLEALPPEARAMAEKLSPRQVGSLFNKLSRRFLTAEQSLAAQKLIDSGPDWGSSAGQQIIALMYALTNKTAWREPDFPSLRSAYLLHARRQRSPHARLVPGDAEALAAVPNALDYLPVYGGRGA